jgi:hypothetical protein
MRRREFTDRLLERRSKGAVREVDPVALEISASS